MIKLPKGTQDYFKVSYDKLSYLKNAITRLFEKYHGEFIETPVFELTQVLMNKYGEDEKLIFNIETENVPDSQEIKDDDKPELQKERISLRYDHTVPLVRFCILNRIEKFRRCCIGKVYRREPITRSQIRLREFYQADFDYVGNFDELVPELEIFSMIQELFKTIKIDNYQILYNYRQNLDYYIKCAGIDTSKFSSVCSSIDKLDKKDRQDIKIELKKKGLSEEQIDRLYTYLFSPDHMMDPSIKNLDEKFKTYLKFIRIIDMNKIIFTPTLARGSDYYTGIIFEVKLINSDLTSSVAGGGRYDKLISSYSKSEIKASCDTPMIGFSFGVDRLIPFIKNHQNPPINFKIWISTIGNINNSVQIKLDLIGRMITKGYCVFYNLSERKFNKEISDANENGCNFIIIIGPNEIKENNITVKNMDTRTQVTIDLDQIDDYFANIKICTL